LTLRLAVGPGVFVPRQRTTFLAQMATELLNGPTDTVVDLCCGCGPVAAALAAVAPGLRLHAVDIDPVAVTYARRNLTIPVHWGDLYQPLPAGLRGRVGVVVANAPHVPTDAITLMPAEARDHEPLRALDGGPDGLDIARRVVAAAPDWLRPGGHLLMEAGRHQAPPLAALMHEVGLQAAVRIDDDRDATVVIGQRR
jgi:release factor glutamine methyltransferase